MSADLHHCECNPLLRPLYSFSRHEIKTTNMCNSPDCRIKSRVCSIKDNISNAKLFSESTSKLSRVNLHTFTTDIEDEENISIFENIFTSEKYRQMTLNIFDRWLDNWVQGIYTPVPRITNCGIVNYSDQMKVIKPKNNTINLVNPLEKKSLLRNYDTKPELNSSSLIDSNPKQNLFGFVSNENLSENDGFRTIEKKKKKKNNYNKL